MIPGPWEGVVLALAAYRLWRFLAEDDFPPLDPMHRWVGTGRHVALQKWLGCPWCSGAWIALAFYGFWLWQPPWTLYVAFGFALSAAVGLIASRLDSD